MAYMMRTLHEFKGLNEWQQNQLIDHLVCNWSFKPVEHDPDLYVQDELHYRLHLVWNSKGHWEMEYNGEEKDASDAIQNQWNPLILSVNRILGIEKWPAGGPQVCEICGQVEPEHTNMCPNNIINSDVFQYRNP